MFLNPNKKAPAIRKVAVTVKKDVVKRSSPTTSAPPMRSLRDAHAANSSKPRTLNKPSPIPAPLRSQSSRKRKVASPALQTFPSDDSDEESDGSLDSAIAPRELKKARTGVLEEDVKRKMRDETVNEKTAVNHPIIHGRDLTTGPLAKGFKPAFPGTEAVHTVRLQYPSICPPEEFELVLPLEFEGYNPCEDIEETVNTICQYYFPPEEADKHVDETSGWRRRMRRARDKGDVEAYKSTIQEFNDFIKESLASGTIQKHLDSIHSMPLPWVERIIIQTYSRTVSPKVHILSKYENGSDDVYGEILPRFAHEIYQNTNLKSDQVFVDLGSGVGNVVLQAALQCGCEAWGVEKMDNPASLGKAQKKEFVARCKRWGIKPGRVHLLHTSFLESPEIDGALRRASSILVNNKAFSSSLNESLLYKFLDLKDGCHITSLKTFVPPNWKIVLGRNDQDPRNVLSVKHMMYGTRSVSWAYEGGEYYQATKDQAKLNGFLNKLRAKASRRGTGA